MIRSLCAVIRLCCICDAIDVVNYCDSCNRYFCDSCAEKHVFRGCPSKAVDRKIELREENDKLKKAVEAAKMFCRIGPTSHQFSRISLLQNLKQALKELEGE